METYISIFENQRIKSSKLADLFSMVSIAILSFVFIISEHTVNINSSSINSIIAIIERYKVKYILLSLFSFVYFIFLIAKKNFKFWNREFLRFLLVIFVFTFISLIFQCKNGFRSFLINEVLFYIVPLIFVYLFINFCNGNIDKYISISFFVCVFWWLVCYLKLLNFNNIRSIDFVHSYSPFESGYAHIFIFYFIYFLFKKNRFNYIIAGILLFLSFKRMNIILELIAILLFVVFKKKTEEISKKTINTISIVFFLFFLVCPFIVTKICSDEFAMWFETKFNYDFNTFVMGRFDRINWCVDEGMKFGLGSTTNYLTSIMGGEARNMHCDILRIYLETTIIGSFFYTYSYFAVSKKNVYVLFTVLTLFLDSLVNHYLGAGHCFLMIVIYFVIFEMGKEKKYESNNLC